MRRRVIVCHNYIGHSCIVHNCVGHNYVGHVGHNCIGHNYVGNDYMIVRDEDERERLRDRECVVVHERHRLLHPIRDLPKPTNLNIIWLWPI